VYSIHFSLYHPVIHHGPGSDSDFVRLLWIKTSYLYRMDNSEWQRNGDFTPSRLEAQKDAVTFLFNVKTQSNPENTVGLLTMAGKG
jgi:hypothetical protein